MTKSSSTAASPSAFSHKFCWIRHAGVAMTRDHVTNDVWHSRLVLSHLVTPGPRPILQQGFTSLCHLYRDLWLSSSTFQKLTLNMIFGRFSSSGKISWLIQAKIFPITYKIFKLGHPTLPSLTNNWWTNTKSWGLTLKLGTNIKSWELTSKVWDLQWDYLEIHTNNHLFIFTE